MADATNFENVLNANSTNIFDELNRIRDAVRTYKEMSKYADDADFPIIDGMSQCYISLRNSVIESRKQRDTLAYKKSFGYAMWNMWWYYFSKNASDYVVPFKYEQCKTENATDDQIEQLAQMFNNIWMQTALRGLARDNVKNCRRNHDAVVYAGYVYIMEFKKIMNI